MTTSAATVTILAAAMVGAFIILRRQQDSEENYQPAPSGPDDAYMGDTADSADQLPTIWGSFMVQTAAVGEAVASATGLTSTPDASTAARNERAFLDMIAYSEGTAGPNGYRTLFGGSLFTDSSDHPRQFFSFKNSRGENLRTSAAGRYQFLSRTWDELANKLDLPDFGPDSQDRAALELIRQRGALNDIRAGRIETAVKKCAPTWASLPGAGYAQPERKLSNLLASYSQAGGTIEA